MRFSDETRYPHPVLSHNTGDFTTGEFDLAFRVHEDPKTGALTLNHRIVLTETSIQGLVETGKASIGCFVRCADTYYSELRMLTWHSGRSDFAAGTLLNRVTLRPIIWLNDNLWGWSPGTIHPEFIQPINLERGSILAIGDEHIISVGQAKLAPFESIFELDCSQDIPEGTFQVDVDQERITILASEKTYDVIIYLRAQADGRPVVMNSVYLPVVMEVLDALQGSDGKLYEERRWYSPFMARCDALGIDPNADGSILENAQRLLDGPAKGLTQLVEESQR